MIKPITPKKASSRLDIPDAVIEAFNELITQNSSHVIQREVIRKIISKMPDVTRAEIFSNGWLNIEDKYRQYGWDVYYDKPGYNETYEPYWVFLERL